MELKTQRKTRICLSAGGCGVEERKVSFAWARKPNNYRLFDLSSIPRFGASKRQAISLCYATLRGARGRRGFANGPTGSRNSGFAGFSFEFFAHGRDPRYPVHQGTISGVKILDERSLRSSDKDRESVRLVKGRSHGRVVAGGEGKSVTVTSHMSRRFSIRMIPKLRAEAGWGIEPPVIHFLVRGLAWLIDIVLVRWIARPASFIRVELADEQVSCPTRTVLSQDMKDTASGFRLVRADVDHVNLLWSDPEWGHRPIPHTSCDGNLAITSRNDGNIGIRSCVDRIGFAVPNGRSTAQA